MLKYDIEMSVFFSRYETNMYIVITLFKSSIHINCLFFLYFISYRIKICVQKKHVIFLWATIFYSHYNSQLVLVNPVDL